MFPSGSAAVVMREPGMSAVVDGNFRGGGEGNS